MTSQVSRTMQYLKKEYPEGVFDIAEYYFRPPYADFGFKKDLFRFIDIVGLYNGGIHAIQCTSGGAMPGHYRKITQDINVRPAAEAWLACGGTITLYGWRKLKVKRGGKAERWEPRIQEITHDDFKG